MPRLRFEGQMPARVMLVQEYPSLDDEASGFAFSGSAGQELNRMLHEAGILRSECFTTSVLKTRPPQGQLDAWMPTKKKDIGPAHHLLKDRYCSKEIHEGHRELLAEIEMAQPNIIVAFGSLSLWALTGHWGAQKWRGSLLQIPDGGPKVIPTLHPNAVFRDWPLRATVMSDLRRVKRHMTSRVYDNKPVWNFIIRPTFDTAQATLQSLLTRASGGEDLWLDFDIETRNGHIDCVGFSWSRSDAICIPFIAAGKPQGYWPEEQEAILVYYLYRLLTHPKVKVRWQNGLYDAQYVYRHWHFVPNGGQDTMISQHSVFSQLAKSLDYLASLYADWYVYWKDEGKIASDVPEDQRWRYNLQDCVYTREVGEVLTHVAQSMNLSAVDRQQQDLFWPVLRAMQLGVRVSNERRGEMAMAIQEELSHREAFLFNILGHSINPASPKQMQTLFYEDLNQAPILKRVNIQGRQVLRPTCDDEALQKLSAREPLLRPLTNAILDIRTLHKFLNDFVMMPLDADERMRCSFNIAGDAGGKSAPYSYRLSSSKNAFGSGGNLQTIPSEKSKSSGKAAARGSMDFRLPNIRSMYIPDPGFTFFDMDLDRADLQVVVWEADDAMLKAALRLGADVHLLNVYALDNKEPPPLEELVESHPAYPSHRGPRKHKREFAKVFCHATNYVGSAKTVAAHTGRTVHEVDRAQKLWFEQHPGILKWHKRTEEQIRRDRFVENKWGYRWHIFDRLDQLLPEACAWVPQSTVGILINKIWLRFYAELPEVQVLLQVHDSLAGQFPTHRAATLVPLMQTRSRIVIPYEDPLIIPTGLKTSVTSWGDCL